MNLVLAAALAGAFFLWRGAERRADVLQNDLNRWRRACYLP